MGYKQGRPTVGVLAGYQTNYTRISPFLEALFDGVRLAARERDCNLLLGCNVGRATSGGDVRHTPAWPLPSPDTLFVPVGPWNCDGLIFVLPLVSEERSRYVRDLRAGGHPVVCVGAGEGGPAVTVDNEGGVRRAMAHLAAHGHRSVAFVGGVETDVEGDSGERLGAYRAAVAEKGLSADPALVAFGGHNQPGGRAATRRILDAGVPFSAVLASNDHSAIGAVRAIEEQGLRVPDDVAVVGFDNLPVTTSRILPLTSVHYPAFEVGHRALELMLDHVAGQGTPDVVRMPTRLVVRASCGCAGPAAVDHAAEGAPADEWERITQRLAIAALDESRRLHTAEAREFCRRLLDGFCQDMDDPKGTAFTAALDEALSLARARGDGPDAWHAAIRALEQETGLLHEQSDPDHERGVDLIRRARIAITEEFQRRHRQVLEAQRRVGEALEWMTARFLAASDEAQVFETLTGHLPEIGIRRADVALFEPQGDDPVARALLRTSPGQESPPAPFAARRFPPPGLYPEDQPFHLAVFPLLIPDEVTGFFAFDPADAVLCGPVVQQLGAALHGVRLYRAAIEGQRRAEEANRAKSQFLSIVSHELRTPLNLVSGLSEMLLSELAEQEKGARSQAEQLRRDVERIHTSARHLDGLIRDVLDLGSSDLGRLQLACESLDPAEVLRSVAAVGEQLAWEQGLAWRAEIPDGLPRVWGDHTRLRQVALNLVSNAVKFTAKGEVVLKVEVWQAADRESLIANRRSPVANRISQTADGQLPATNSNAMHDRRLAMSDEPAIVISVSDTGLGIPPSEQETIFHEFRQSERTATRGYGGLGLGLAICKRLVEMHGGRIWAESPGEEGGGSTFTFTLPVLEKEEEEKGGRGEEGRVEKGKEGAVLVLGEKAGDAEPLVAHLAERGFRVEGRTAGRDDWLEEVLADPPGALALGFRPGSERGWEVMRAIKANPATRHVPVLLYALEEEEDSGAVLEMDYVTKPVGTADLAQALARQGLGTDSASERTILIVDDEPGILDMHARVVQAQLPGCQVLTAPNGREALDVIRRELPDLVLLDLMMPEMDGFGVLEEMRAAETTRAIPVIVLTGQVLTEADVERLNRGVAAVLEKGLYTAGETLVHIEQALARSKQLDTETQHIVRQAMAYVHAHYAEAISREDLARHTGVSERHLTRCFRQETGVTPMAYLNRYRVVRAKELLASGEKQIAQIAREVGFADGSSLARVFRRETGVSPGEYRKSVER